MYVKLCGWYTDMSVHHQVLTVHGTQHDIIDALDV